MRIGFLLPADFAVGSRASGIAEQARRQADALEGLGHAVVRLNPWEWQDERELDVLQFFLGGPAMADLAAHRNLCKPGLLVFAPIIDSNQSFRAYRLAATAGGLASRFFTVPGILRRQALASDVVICRSSHEAQRVVRGLGVPAENTAIVLNGCAAPAEFRDDPAEVRARLGLPEQFVLHVSAFSQERKNVVRLIEATQRLRYPLVLAGAAQPGPILAEIHRRAAGNDRIRILEFVDEPTKAALYALCRVFCLPSTHEGTGLAALEAAAAGAKIVITRNGGAPDYFLNRAEYVDPRSVESIQRAIGRAWMAPRDAELRRHVAQQLSWSESARSLERVYLNVFKSKSRGADAATGAGSQAAQRADFA